MFRGVCCWQSRKKEPLGRDYFPYLSRLCLFRELHSFSAGWRSYSVPKRGVRHSLSWNALLFMRYRVFVFCMLRNSRACAQLLSCFGRQASEPVKGYERRWRNDTTKSESRRHFFLSFFLRADDRRCHGDVIYNAGLKTEFSKHQITVATHENLEDAAVY